MLLSKNQINKCGDAFSQDSTDLKAFSAVQEYRIFRLNCLNTTIRILNSAGLPQNVFVSARLKRLDSIYRKLTRENTNFKLGGLEDVIGLRIICRSFSEAQKLDARLAKLPESYRVIDHTQPNTNSTGYRCIHRIMSFQQKLNDESVITVRFEIQIRSFYQHRWAIWSESHGEEMKLGAHITSPQMLTDQNKLVELSKQIADWEMENPKQIQHHLTQHVGNTNLICVWKQKNLKPVIEEFSDDIAGAVNHLNYLELQFPAARNNALLLVGVADAAQAEFILKETHPLFADGVISPPSEWAQAIINS